MMTLDNIVVALLLTLVAGMATAVGALMAFFTKKGNNHHLSGALGLSAGVMVYVSFMELVPDAVEEMGAVVADPRTAMFYVLLSFFGGMGLIALIDWLVPEDENPHEVHLRGATCPDGSRLKRTGTMLAFTIGIHNFPEGVATFVSGLEGADIALPIVVAVAIHNIPEGIAVSVPILQATGNRRKAFWYSALSGLAEPVGALFALLFLLPLWTPVVSSVCLAAVAGIMVYIAFDELLPNSEAYGHHHWAIGGVIAGMAVMAFGLLLF
ncbi:zinc transporter ZupT [uncultured Muribaculum sp.]|uniref:zinc transporter ZupT n=1 Tax=uncultured Muribaculum sp. TaxID=1918613 RepID=UPI0034204F45